MKLPVGMLIYWVCLLEEDTAMLMGLWYYKEMYVPSSIEEKKHSALDLKDKRCTALMVTGKFDQIMDLIGQGDLFQRGNEFHISQYTILVEKIKKTALNKPYLFDDIYHLQGTSLMIDTAFEIDETIEDIKQGLKIGNGVFINISEYWSFANDLMSVFGS